MVVDIDKQMSGRGMNRITFRRPRKERQIDRRTELRARSGGLVLEVAGSRRWNRLPAPLLSTVVDGGGGGGGGGGG